MLVIEEKNGTWLNFFTPAIVIGAAGALLGLLNLVIPLFVLLILPLEFDIVILRLLITLLIQIFGAIITVFLLIPFFKVKNVEYQAISSGTPRRRCH